jgi:glycosyltransferase involved in cell wall biosynthesis
MGSQKIVFLSAGQPSINPRLVKEADALCDIGYEVVVLYAYWNNWGFAFDKQLIPTKKWRAICVGGDPDNDWLVYFLSKFFYSVAKYTNKITKGKMLSEVAIARPAYFLKRVAKNHTADLYIAHTLGALPAAISAAKRYTKPVGFDAEDFHRNETSDDINNADVIIKTKIENKYLPQIHYFTVSSPQIAMAYKQLFPHLSPLVLFNVFPKSNIINIHRNTNQPIKLFWFSQTIGPNRGINDIVNALLLLPKHQFELHLLGSTLHSNETFIDELINCKINITLHKPIPPNEIINFAANFDIGLALENIIPFNRDICLTNKLFTYMQAGLAVIASDTTAQRDFIYKNPKIGSIYPSQNAHALANLLSNYYQDHNMLHSCKNSALLLAHTQYNWEVESLKFMEIVKETLSENFGD